MVGTTYAFFFGSCIAVSAWYKHEQTQTLLLKSIPISKEV